MRDIKFRGYCGKDSEWRYGFYATDTVVHEILTMINGSGLYGSQIDVDSLGQYTGLKDANDVEIYEGDVIEQTVVKHYWRYVIKEVGGQFGNTLFAVCYENNVSVDEDTGFYTFEKQSVSGCRDYVISGNRTKVIGNIYENPELMK